MYVLQKNSFTNVKRRLHRKCSCTETNFNTLLFIHRFRYPLCSYNLRVEVYSLIAFVITNLIPDLFNVYTITMRKIRKFMNYEQH